MIASHRLMHHTLHATIISLSRLQYQSNKITSNKTKLQTTKGHSCALESTVSTSTQTPWKFYNVQSSDCMQVTRI